MFEKPAFEKNQNNKKERIGENEPDRFDFKFYVTDHSSDKTENFSAEELKQLYKDIEKDGIESIRYDWRWKNIEKNRGNMTSCKSKDMAKPKKPWKMSVCKSLL